MPSRFFITMYLHDCKKRAREAGTNVGVYEGSKYLGMVGPDGVFYSQNLGANANVARYLAGKMVSQPRAERNVKIPTAIREILKIEADFQAKRRAA